MATGKTREKLVELLEETAEYMRIVGENDFKVRAYEKGAAAIAASEADLDSIASGKTKIAGVGEGLRGAVSEFLESGKIAQHGALAKQIPPGVLEIMQVPGVGPKKAFLIHKELGVNSIGELEYACREHRLVTLKGFGQAIQTKILSGIEQLKANAGRFRLNDALAMGEPLLKALNSALGKPAEIRFVGELGRHAEIVDGLEIYFETQAKNVTDSLTKVAEKFFEKKTLHQHHEKVLKAGLIQWTAKLSDNGFPVTLWMSRKEIDEPTLHWLCASAELRPALARDAQGYEGWECSWLESEWIAQGRRPAGDAYRCSRDGKVKGVFHCHTDFSDGSGTLEQMVRGAEERGYEYIGISDHSQTAAYAQGLKPDRIREQRKMIQALQKKVAIRIFHGIESDILADGALDYDREILDGFDFIVGSIHSRFQMDEAVMTDRLVRALSNPATTIWGHPTGRLLLGRSGYKLDWKKCLDAAAKNAVAVEFNSNPHRLDLDWRLGGELEQRGIAVCINPDAHEVEGLDDTRYGEFMAEKAMLPRGQILNLMGAAEMEKYLSARKQR